jgi:hypothetical protein
MLGVMVVVSLLECVVCKTHDTGQRESGCQGGYWILVVPFQKVMLIVWRNKRFKVVIEVRVRVLVVLSNCVRLLMSCQGSDAHLMCMTRKNEVTAQCDWWREHDEAVMSFAFQFLDTWYLPVECFCLLSLYAMCPINHSHHHYHTPPTVQQRLPVSRLAQVMILGSMHSASTQQA